jgi:hypothetical protein
MLLPHVDRTAVRAGQIEIVRKLLRQLALLGIAFNRPTEFHAPLIFLLPTRGFGGIGVLL